MFRHILVPTDASPASARAAAAKVRCEARTARDSVLPALRRVAAIEARLP